MNTAPCYRSSQCQCKNALVMLTGGISVNQASRMLSIGNRPTRITPLLLRHLLDSEKVEMVGFHIRPAPTVSPLMHFLKALIRIATDVLNEAIERL